MAYSPGSVVIPEKGGDLVVSISPEQATALRQIAAWR